MYVNAVISSGCFEEKALSGSKVRAARATGLFFYHPVNLIVSLWCCRYRSRHASMLNPSP